MPLLHAPARLRRVATPAAIALVLAALFATTFLASAPPARAAVEGLTVTPTAELADGGTVTISGSLPATHNALTTGIYVMWCAEGTGRLGGDACADSPTQLWITSANHGTVTEGMWNVNATLSVPAAFKSHVCEDVADSTTQCGIFIRLDHNHGADTTYDQFVPVSFAAPEPEPEPVDYGLTVTPAEDLEGGDTVTVAGLLPATHNAVTTGIYVMWCAEGTGRLSGDACAGSPTQLWITSANHGTVTEGVWSIDATLAVPAEFKTHVCEDSADATAQCGIFIRLDHNHGADTTYDQFFPVTFAAPALPTPTVSVSKTEDLNPEGETVTIIGSGFVPNPPATNGTRQPLPALFSGAYVTFGQFADAWTPSSGALSSQRKVVSQKWVVNQASFDHIATNFPSQVPQLIVADEDGNFTLTLDVNEAAAHADFDGNWGIYTYPGSGAVYAPFETYTALTFAEPEPEYGLTVSPTEDLVDGDTVTVTGTLPAVHNTITAGAYVMWCAEGTGRLSGDACAGSPAQLWITSANHGTVTDGVWNINATLDVPATFKAHVCENVADSTSQCGIFIRLDHNHGADTTYDEFFPVTFAAADIEPSPSPEPTPTPEPEIPTVPVPVGRLTWGVDADFRSYVTGTIAQGSITTSGASYSGGNFTFVQTGGNANPTAGTGTGTYGGSVRFQGHGGELDLTFSSPYVRLTGTTSAMLSVSVNGSRVDFASLNLGAATKTSSDGAVRFAGAPATLTAAGADAFEDFYAAGRTLSPVTVTFGAGAVASGGGGVAVAYVAPTTTELPATPPASEGIVLEDAILAKLIAGELTTITVAGFEPGETVQVVIYSTPTLLGTVTADAAGTATWTGSLPDGLTGEHTLVFVGANTSKGVVITIPAALTTPGQCVAEPSTLSWGFKEAFLAYLDSSIANGEWEVSGEMHEQDGIFVWRDGIGALENGPSGTVAFTGSIRFTGHEGVLDTTISDPVIEFAEDGTYLLLDVTGETQQGEAVDAAAVRFAQLDLDAGYLGDEDGVVVYNEIPAVLTAEGAEAFGTYPAGEQLDPVTFALESDGCALVVFGLVSDPMPSVEPEPSGEAEADTGAEESDFPAWVVWTLAGVIAAAIAAGVLALNRRRLK